jgi:hypothetical protein
MGVLFASLLVLPAIEFFLRFPFVTHIRATLEVGRKSAAVIMARHASDHRKERVLLRYARDMAMHTLMLVVLLAGLAGVIMVPALFLDWLLAPAPSTVESLVSLPGIAGMTLVAAIYLFVRKWLGQS